MDNGCILKADSFAVGGRRAWKCKAPPISVLLSGAVTEASSLRGYKSPAEGLSIIRSSGAIREKSHKSKFIRVKMGTFLVAQWLRIRLPVQGTRVRAMVREDPTCRGAAKPVCHNY